MWNTLADGASRCKVTCIHSTHIYTHFFADGVNCWISRIFYMFHHVLRQSLFLALTTQNMTFYGCFHGRHLLCVLGEMPAGNTFLTLYHEQDNCVVMTHDNSPLFEGDNITLRERRVVVNHHH